MRTFWLATTFLALTYSVHAQQITTPSGEEEQEIYQPSSLASKIDVTAPRIKGGGLIVWVGSRAYRDCELQDVSLDGRTVAFSSAGGNFQALWASLPPVTQKRVDALYQRKLAAKVKAAEQMSQMNAAAQTSTTPVVASPTPEFEEKDPEYIYFKIIQVLDDGVLGQWFHRQFNEISIPGRPKMISTTSMPTEQIVHIVGLKDNPAEGQMRTVKAKRLPKNYRYISVDKTSRNIEEWEVVEAD